MRGVRPEVALPFDMFDDPRGEAEVAAAKKLAGIYHKGQKRAWHGKELLDELVLRHGGITLGAEERRALQQLFAVILWGELAAWKVSADLALQLEPLEAKMAATSQAHDEARHFYVMHDYLALLGEVPKGLPPATTRVLHGTLQADTLTKKLVGMQMMVEPMALALFQMVRESRIEPVLCDLVTYYERDEARHVALGVLHLPKLLKGLTPLEAVDLWGWEFREYLAQMRMLRELEPHFRRLGMDVRRVIEIGRNKQVRANQMLTEEIGAPSPVLTAFVRFFDAKTEWEWPSAAYDSRREHLEAVWKAAFQGTGMVPGELTDVAA
jgi:hypothetical protein